MKPCFPLSLVNHYLAYKQHLLPTSRLEDVLPATAAVVALHATAATGPYLSLWARVAGFQRPALEDALYGTRELVKCLCMRTTLHVVPSEQYSYFFQAYAGRRLPAERRTWEALLVQAGLCQEEQAGILLDKLYQRVLDVLDQKETATVRQISQAVPELKAKVRHDVGKSYEGEFSIGSRLVPGMCTAGLLVRARPQGTWRSNLYEYAALVVWLPGVDLTAVTSQESQAWLVRRYLSAFGPASWDDVRWWTGFSKGETTAALESLRPVLAEVAVEGLREAYLMLAEDAERLDDFVPEAGPGVFFLPGLDPYIMGYADRRRFLAVEHRAKVFDRAGNAMPTVWAHGRVVGAWRQRQDGRVVYGLFEPVGEEEQGLLAGEARRLESFLGSEFLPLRPQTPFLRALT